MEVLVTRSPVDSIRSRLARTPPTNAMESVFATVQLRTEKTKGSGSRMACLTMVFMLTESASMK